MFPLSFWVSKYAKNRPTSATLSFLMQDKKLLLEKDGPHVARISVFEVCSTQISLSYIFFFFFEKLIFVELENYNRTEQVVLKISLRFISMLLHFFLIKIP